MMKLSSAGLLLLSAALFPTGAANAAPDNGLKLERVTMLMRHGVRPPTKPDPNLTKYSTDAWPKWPVDYGLLTQRGAAAIALLGQAERRYYADRGLFGATGCPTAGSLVVKASGKSRAISSAQSWTDAFAPGCGGTVAHPDENGPDPIFHGLDEEPAEFDGQRAYREALAQAPNGQLQKDILSYRSDLVLLAHTLGCAPSACALFTDPNELVASAHDRPELRGPVDYGSTASQSILMEYLEGMPMKDVGWGRVTRPQIEQMLSFHPLKFKYANRPDYVARFAAAPIAREMLSALTSSNGPRLSLLTGHDTNIADLGGFLKLHWHVPSYPPDEIPPGSALGLELLRDGKGQQFVRAFYRSQTMDQVRYQQPLTGTNKVFRQYLAIPDCGNSAAERACPLSRFIELVQRRALP